MIEWKVDAKRTTPAPFAQPTACPQTRPRRTRSHLASGPAARLLRQRRRCRSLMMAAFSRRRSRRAEQRRPLFDSASNTCRIMHRCSRRSNSSGSSRATTEQQRQPQLCLLLAPSRAAWSSNATGNHRPATIASRLPWQLFERSAALLCSLFRSPRLGHSVCALHTPPDLRRRWL